MYDEFAAVMSLESMAWSCYIADHRQTVVWKYVGQFQSS